MLLPHSTTMKDSEMELIKKNLLAFEANFGEIYLHRYQHGSFEIYLKASDISENNFVQYCENVDYLNGWLYGVVQGDIVRIRTKTKED